MAFRERINIRLCWETHSGSCFRGNCQVKGNVECCAPQTSYQSLYLWAGIQAASLCQRDLALLDENEIFYCY